MDELVVGNLKINSLVPKSDELKALVIGKVDDLVTTETALDETFLSNLFL